MKYIIYCRVSTKRQGDGYGLEAQSVAVHRFLNSLTHPYEVIGHFNECESGANSKRPQLAAAIALARQHKGNVKIVVARLDRLTRSVSFLFQLQDAGVPFVSIENPNLDSFMLGILGLVSQREREVIASRIKSALAVCKSKGVTLGNPRLHLARQNALQAIQARKSEFAANALKSIMEIQSTGCTSLNRIAHYMNLRHEPTSRGTGRWTATAIARIVNAK